MFWQFMGLAIIIVGAYLLCREIPTLSTRKKYQQAIIPIVMSALPGVILMVTGFAVIATV